MTVKAHDGERRTEPRPKLSFLSFCKNATDEIEALLSNQTVVQTPTGRLTLSIPNPDDERIVAEAMAGEADTLVTGDADLQQLGKRAPLPRQQADDECWRYRTFASGLVEDSPPTTGQMTARTARGIGHLGDGGLVRLPSSVTMCSVGTRVTLDIIVGALDDGAIAEETAPCLPSSCAWGRGATFEPEQSAASPMDTRVAASAGLFGAGAACVDWLHVVHDPLEEFALVDAPTSEAFEDFSELCL